MSILLTHAYFLEDDPREKLIMRPYPPLGILCISAFLDQQNIAHDVFDTTFSSKDAFKKYLLTKKPNVVGFYVNLMTKPNVVELVQYIKTHFSCTVILGGPEVRSSAENFLRHGADYIVLGEGEETTAELIQTLTTNKNTDLIKSIAFLKDGTFIQNPEREKMKDLDELPIPNRKKIDFNLYLNTWHKHHGSSAISVSTMRGCPYTCKWCSRAVYGLSYRRRSPKKVIEELELIKAEYNPNTIWFVDDVFTISHKWLQEFHELIKTKNLNVSYECITRADRMNEEVIRMLKDTGCFRVWIGAESGSQKVIDLMDRRVDVQKVREMIQLTKRHGIEAGTFIMLGYPGETEADIEETIHHLKASDPDHFTITVAYPIRGTELYEEVEALQTTSLDWSTTTDRQIDFKRMYPRKYYDHAVRRVISEVNYHKNKAGAVTASLLKLKIKSVVAKICMWWYRSRLVPKAN